jgi:hypothetical protein
VESLLGFAFDGVSAVTTCRVIELNAPCTPAGRPNTWSIWAAV